MKKLVLIILFSFLTISISAQNQMVGQTRQYLVSQFGTPTRIDSTQRSNYWLMYESISEYHQYHIINNTVVEGDVDLRYNSVDRARRDYKDLRRTFIGKMDVCKVQLGDGFENEKFKVILIFIDKLPNVLVRTYLKQ